MQDFAPATTWKRRARRFGVSVLLLPYRFYAALPIRRPACALIRLSEWCVSFPPFLLSLWCSAFYRSIIAGWHVSGLESADKAKVLKVMLGADES